MMKINLDEVIMTEVRYLHQKALMLGLAVETERVLVGVKLSKDSPHRGQWQDGTFVYINGLDRVKERLEWKQLCVIFPTIMTSRKGSCFFDVLIEPFNVYVIDTRQWVSVS